MTTQLAATARPRRAAGDAPRCTPSAAQLDELEVRLLGALGPAVVGHGLLEIVLPTGDAVQALNHGSLLLTDEEGTPYAAVDIDGLRPVEDGQVVHGAVRAVGRVARGSHVHLRSPAGERPGPVLGVPLDEPLTTGRATQLQLAAEQVGARLLLLPLTGTGSPRHVDGPGLVRSCLAVQERIRAEGRIRDVEVVPVALPRLGDDACHRDRAVRVAAAYGSTSVPADDGGTAVGAEVVSREHGLRPVPLPDVALDPRDRRWRPGTGSGALSVGETLPRLQALIRRGAPIPDHLADPVTVREVRRRVERAGRGCAIMFTGLSGSGKSTIARAVREALLAGTDRSVTLLDGDVVRRLLSSELTFSRPHRELNVQRIGYVAAEVAKHGGLALCAPIAPYAAVRAEVRSMVEGEGSGFLLVHVATALTVCESRDRKGLYAKARRGELAAFTGVSDPYEVPDDADLVIDTGVVAVPDAVAAVLRLCTERGWVQLDDGVPEGVER